MRKISARWLPPKKLVLNNTLKFPGSLRTFKINSSCQKTKVQNLATGPRDASNCKPDIMHLIGLAASAKNDLRVYQCCVSMHGKVDMSTRLWDENRSAGWCKYIRVWDWTILQADAKQLEAYHVSCERRIIGQRPQGSQDFVATRKWEQELDLSH